MPKSHRRTWSAWIVSFLITVAVIATQTVAVAIDTGASTGTATRLSGPERVATAVAVSRHGWSSSPAVVIARADDPADGLTGSAVAGRLGGPLLITPREELAPAVATEIRRLGARRAIVLGGRHAVSPKVVEQLRGAGLQVQRLAGSNRYATAAQAATWLAPKPGGTAFLVADWADALAVSASAARDAAAGRPQPILLASGQLPAETRAALRSLAVRTVTVVDGDRRIPARVDDQLRADGLRVDRVAGRSRYEVSRTLLAREMTADPTARPLILATGEQFPDGLGAGALAARIGGRLMLTSTTAGSAAELDWLSNRWSSIGQLYVIGGEAAVAESHVLTLFKKPTTSPGKGGGSGNGKTKDDSTDGGTTDGGTTDGGTTDGGTTDGGTTDGGTTDGGTTDGGTTDETIAGHRGLHFTAAEVEIWRERSRSGPYRTAGDAGANSPGDWDRIARNAATFRSAPSAGHWTGPSQGGPSTCVQKGDDVPPVAESAALRDAAFHALVTGDRTAVPALKQTLLTQAREPGTDFSNGARWCTGVLYDVTPSFQLSHWLTKLMFAYDYLGDEFTADQRRVLDGWFAAGARFLQVDLDRGLDGLFVDRQAGDYRLSAQTQKYPWCGRRMYAGSAQTCQIHRSYNNRRAAIARYVGLVGLAQGDLSLRTSGSRFVEEFLSYGLFPEGGHADMERWNERIPDLGWAYAANTVAPVAVLADAFARSGDPSLYAYQTSSGAFGSEGGTKDLRFAVTSLGRYVNGGYQRYATEDPSLVGDVGTRIDGVHGDWHSIHDVGLAFTNLYFRDAAIRAQYTRSGTGYTGYPARPASSGPNPVWMGDGGIFPGVLFMFGQLEGQVDPYPVRR